MSSTYIFGIHPVATQLKALSDNVEVLYLSNQRHDAKIKFIEEMARNNQIVLQVVDNQYLDKITGHKNHQGVAAKVNMNRMVDLKQQLQQLDGVSNITFLALDGITDPQNLGAILRTAECFGVNLVILPKNNSANIDNAVVMKTASGALNFLNIALVNNLTQAIELCKEYGFWVAGTSLSQNSISLDKFEVTPRLLWIMGSEGNGLKRLVAEHCDYLVTIPMIGKTQSLNVSVATGVVLSYTNMFRNR